MPGSTMMVTVRRASLFVAFVLTGALSESVQAASLYLPRQFDPVEMGTVGIALVNPTLTTASLTFRLRSSTGAVLATSTSSIPPKGQIALSVAQSFPNATAAGWLSVDSDIDQVTGLWMGGDFVTSTDGARLLSTNDGIAYPAFTYLKGTTEISFANLGSSTLSGNLNLVSAAGSTVATVAFQVPALGLFQRPVASLFPSQVASLDTAGFWINVNSSSSAAKVIGTSVTTRPGADNIVANLVSVSYAKFVFPHVVGGQLGGTVYDSLLTLTNYRTATTVTLTLTLTSGSVLSVQRTIPMYGVLQASITALFNVASVDGWLLVDTGGGSMSGLLTYTDTAGGGSTAVEMQSTNAGDTVLIFGHIANVNPWWTGIALSNATTTDAQVEVFAFSPAGTLLTGPENLPIAAFTLPAQTKRAFLLDDLLPELTTRTSDGGYIFVRTANGVQIHGIELFFLRSGRVYSNVPPTRLTALNIGFTPPAAAAANSSGTIVVDQVYLGNTDFQPITTMQACSTVSLNMVVNNTTNRTVPVTRQYRALGPNGYVLYMASFNRDQAPGRLRYYSNVTVPCDAPSGTYTLTGSLDYNGVLSSASASFQAQGTSGGGGSGGGGTGGGGGGGGGACVPSSTTICVPSADSVGTPLLTSAACYDTYTRKSSVTAIKLQARGGSPISGYTWTLSGGSTFPTGTTVESLTGIFKGTSANVIPGRYNFSMTVSDGSRTATGNYELIVETGNGDPFGTGTPCGVGIFQQPSNPTINLPAATEGRYYGATLELVVGNAGTPLVWSVVAGQLPPGLVLDQANGIVRGTPFSSAAGSTYRFRVAVRSLNPSPFGPDVAVGAPEYVIRVQ
jgi:hypothetical protein